MKRVLKILAFILSGIILLLLILPLLFKKQLAYELKKAVNKNINARMDFEDVNVSLIRSFPNVNLQVLLMEIDGIDEFEGIRLLSTEKIELDLDLSSLIRPSKGIRIRSLEFINSAAEIMVTEDGKANYDIAKSESEETSLFLGEIEHYAIENANINYNDKSSDTRVSVNKLYHSGSGQFRNTEFDLQTETSIDDLQLIQAGLPYAKDMQLDSRMTIRVDLNKNRYELAENEITINELLVKSTGFVEMQDEDIVIELDVKAPDNKVESLLSIVPGMYKSSYEQIISEGRGRLEAKVSGIYNANKSYYPALDMVFELNDALIQYPDMPLPLKELNALVEINASEKDWSDMQLLLNNLQMIIDKRQIGATARITELTGDMHVDAKLTGSLAMNSLSKALPSAKALKDGLLKTDLKLDAKKSDIINRKFENIVFQGKMELDNFKMNYKNEDLLIERLEGKFSPAAINMKLKSLQFAQSDLDLEGQLKNPLALMLRNELSQLDIKGKSKSVNVDLLSSYATQETQGSSENEAESAAYHIGDVNISYVAGLINYEKHELKDLKLQGSYNDGSLDIKNASLVLNGDAMQLRGNIYNIDSYINASDTLGGELFWTAESLDFNKFSNPESTGEELETILVPPRINIDFHADIENLKYSELSIQKFRGKLSIKDRVMSLLDTRADLFNAHMSLEGNYDCSKTSEPRFDFKYDIIEMPYKSLFDASPLFKSLAPLAEYIEGQFNSTLVMSGPLGENMMPILNQLDASGIIETLQAEIKSWPATNKLADKLGIEELRSWYIRDSKNWFEVDNGKVLLQPFEIKHAGMSYAFSGSYGLDKKMDLKIKSSIPREMLNATAAGSAVNKAFGEIETEANKLGVDLSTGSELYFDIALTGSFTDPSLKVRPTGSGGQSVQKAIESKIKEETTKVQDSIKSRIDSEKEKVKDTLSRVVETEKEKIKEEFNKELEAEKEKIKTGLKEKLDTSLTNIGIDSTLKIKKQLDEAIKATGASEIDSIKAKINDWNPFKKKKKK